MRCHSVRAEFAQHNCIYLFLVCWIIGVFAGSFSAFSSDFVSALVRLCVKTPISVIGAVSHLLFPLMFWYLCWLMSSRYLIICFSFVKAYSFSFCVTAVLLTFGDAGWLIQFLLLFADYVLNFALFIMLLQIVRKQRSTAVKTVSVYLFITAPAVLVDYFLLSPYLKTLLTFIC